MFDPLLLVAVAFFSIVGIGSLLVAVNDWLEARWHSARQVRPGKVLAQEPLQGSAAFAPRRYGRRSVRLG